MIKALLKWLFLLPIGLFLLGLAVANRESVRVVLDPLPGEGPMFETQVPLFLVAFASAILGIVAGSFVTWMTQGRHRRSARQARAEAERLRHEAARLRGELATRSGALTGPAERPRDAA
jgi:uncharacterized integral membrane protein